MYLRFVTKVEENLCSSALVPSQANESPWQKEKVAISSRAYVPDSCAAYGTKHLGVSPT